MLLRPADQVLGHDPDGTLWEVYTFDGDIDHRGAGQAQERSSSARWATADSRAGGGVGTPHERTRAPARIPLADGPGTDEVRLRGTLNLPLSAERPLSRPRRSGVEAGRPAVRPRPPVSARARSRTPTCRGRPGGAVGAVRGRPGGIAGSGRAGRRGMLKFDPKPCFVRDGVGMRELQLEGFEPARGGGVEVMYKGPFREVRDDGGRCSRGAGASRYRPTSSAVPNGRMGQPVHHLRISLDVPHVRHRRQRVRRYRSSPPHRLASHRDHPRPG